MNEEANNSTHPESQAATTCAVTAITVATICRGFCVDVFGLILVTRWAQKRRELMSNFIHHQVLIQKC